MNYYNEFDPYAAAWLRNLIAEKLIPYGVVDERSIEDVAPSDLAGFTQCHFFAGIAGWSLALSLAGFPDDYPIWTGSCPCQPFSTASEGKGIDDERHLWPAFHWLIQQCRPARVVGEQVASKIAEPWIDLVSADLEGMGYAFGAVAFPSASVGAPHIRDRTYWVADRDRCRQPSIPIVRLPNSRHHAKSRCTPGSDRLGPTNGYWSAVDWIACRDGKWRPVEPGTFPLAYGVSGRVGRLRAYGNAINPWQAAQFLEAALR